MSGQFFHLWNKLLKLCNLCLPISSDHRESWVIFLTRKQRAWGSDYSLPLHTYLSGSKESPVRPANPTPGACPAPGISSAPGNGWKGCWWGPRLHAPARGWKEDPLFPQRHLCLWPWGLLCLCLVGFSLLLVCLFAFFQKSGIFPAPSSFWEKIQVDHVPTSPVPISLVLSLQNSPLSQNHKEKKKKSPTLCALAFHELLSECPRQGALRISSLSPPLETLMEGPHCSCRPDCSWSPELNDQTDQHHQSGWGDIQPPVYGLSMMPGGSFLSRLRSFDPRVLFMLSLPVSVFPSWEIVEVFGKTPCPLWVPSAVTAHAVAQRVTSFKHPISVSLQKPKPCAMSNV